MTPASEQQLPLRSTRDVTRPHDDAALPRRVLVLGATSGIAEACARLWAQRGDHLHLVARNRDRLEAVAADLRCRGAASVTHTVADLDDTRAHPDLLTHAIHTLGGMDIAFVALGVLGDQHAGENDFEAAATVLHTNFTAAVSLLTWLGNDCAQRHSGTLAVLSSVAGERGRKSNYIYGASKAGLTTFTDGLRNRLDREGVRVMTIKPGPVRTAMTDGMGRQPLLAEADTVAGTLVAAIDRGQDVVYVPGIWRWIMAVIRLVPDRIFKKKNL